MATIKVYRTYNFIDKDPVIDEIRTLVQDVHMMARLNDVGTLSGVSPSTLRNWFGGITKRPQNATTMAVVTALGYERKFVRARDLNADAELPLALAWLKREQAKAERAAAPKKRKPHKSKAA